MVIHIEKYISSVMKDRSIPGSSVAIVKGKEIIWSKGFGFANIEEKVEAKPDTIYRFCSITKPFVTTGFLQLMEKGKFDLDEPVNQYLENTKVKTIFSEEPTIRDLLTHRSGLPTIGTPRARDECDALSTEDYISKFARAIRPPGLVHGYSNPGLIIIGYLIELFSGKPYPVYIKENLLKPLEMDSSDFYLSSSMEKYMSTGYGRRGPEEPIQAAIPYKSGVSPPAASANLFSTCTDFAHFIIAQMNEGEYKGKNILKKETLEKSHRLQVSAGNSRSGMGLSWFRFIHNGNVVIRHTCGMLGWTSHVAFYPDKKIGVIWNTNLNDGSGWRPPATNILSMVSGEYEKFDPKKISLKPIPDEWKKIEGTYGSPGKTHQIKIENGNLILIDGESKVFLEKIEGSRYIVHCGSNDGYELTFEYDKNGRVKQFDLGASVVPRYLIGCWRVKHTTNPILFDFTLDIKSDTEAEATGMNGKRTAFTSFNVEENNLKVSFETTLNQDVIGLPPPPPKYVVNLELMYIENLLVGQIKMNREKANTKVPGTLIVLSRSQNI